MVRLPVLGKKSSGEDDPGGEDKQAHPARVRLRAWWEGYDVDEYAAMLARRRAGEDEPDADGSGNGTDPAGVPVAEMDENPPPIESEDRELPYKPWERSRAAVSRYVSGPELCGPGGAENIVNMCKLLALKPEMNLLEIGSGLGGHARALAEEFGCWVTGYDRSEKIVAAANELSNAAGMARKAMIEPLDPALKDGFARNYDRAFSKEAFYLFEDKRRLVGLIHDHLKPMGLLLVTDYVLRDESVREDPDYEAWAAAEGKPIYPLIAEEFGKMFKDFDFVVRVDEDVTKKVVPLVDQTWKGADQLVPQLTARPDGSDLIKIMMREGDLWQRRLKLMRDGRMMVWRIVASKVGGRPDGLSNW